MVLNAAQNEVALHLHPVMMIPGLADKLVVDDVLVRGGRVGCAGTNTQRSEADRDGRGRGKQLGYEHSFAPVCGSSNGQEAVGPLMATLRLNPLHVTAVFR